MGSLHKELAKANVPLFLMSAHKDISVILKESTNIDFPTIDSPNDLECLIEQSKILIYISHLSILNLNSLFQQPTTSFTCRSQLHLWSPKC